MTQETPDRRACVVFTQGCPLRCAYCHDLPMAPHRRGKSRESQAIYDVVEYPHDLLEGAVIGAGKPGLHGGLKAALRKAKTHGCDTGLHTTGLYPERLAQVLPWLDWVGLDINGWGMNPAHTRSQRDIWHRNLRSLALLLDSDIELECRTVLNWRNFSLGDVEKLALSLADCGVRHYILQMAHPVPGLDHGDTRPLAGTPSNRSVDLLAARLAPHFEHVAVRRQVTAD